MREVGSVRRDQEMFQRVQSRFDLTLIRDFFYSLTLKKIFCIIYIQDKDKYKNKTHTANLILEQSFKLSDQKKES